MIQQLRCWITALNTRALLRKKKERNDRMTKQHEEELLEMVTNNTINPLQDEDTFIAGCKQCGKCCRNRNDIILNAFDVFHIAQATGKTMREVADKYGESYIGESSGMPLIVLKYRKDSFGDGTTCYFLAL